MRRTLGMFAIAALTGCAVESAEPGIELGVTQQAISACDEMVPANRFIDGFPAYAQCAATMNSAIFSNNGIDTSITQVSPDWVRTQYSGGYQCTELAHRYLLFKWDITWLPRGNAGEWCDTAPPANSGVVQTTTPVHGDLMVLAPGSCGAAQGTGHVVVVDKVEAGGRLSVVEQNRANRGSYMSTCGKCFLHVVANDGSGTGGAGTDAPVPGGTGAPGGSAAPGGRGGPGNTGGAGSTAPPMTTPPMTVPPMTVPPMTVPPMTVPPAAAPMTTAPAAMAGTGASGVQPTPVPIPVNASTADDSGCTVARGAGSRGAPLGGAGLLGLALAALCARGARRRR